MDETITNIRRTRDGRARTHRHTNRVITICPVKSMIRCRMDLIFSHLRSHQNDVSVSSYHRKNNDWNRLTLSLWHRFIHSSHCSRWGKQCEQSKDEKERRREQKQNSNRRMINCRIFSWEPPINTAINIKSNVWPPQNQNPDEIRQKVIELHGTNHIESSNHRIDMRVIEM